MKVRDGPLIYRNRFLEIWRWVLFFSSETWKFKSHLASPDQNRRNGWRFHCVALGRPHVQDLIVVEQGDNVMSALVYLGLWAKLTAVESQGSSSKSDTWWICRVSFECLPNSCVMTLLKRYTILLIITRESIDFGLFFFTRTKFIRLNALKVERVIDKGMEKKFPCSPVVLCMCIPQIAAPFGKCWEIESRSTSPVFGADRPTG